MNPLLKKELRTRLRGNTIFVIENAYLLLLTCVFLIMFVSSPFVMRGLSWEIGRNLFETIGYMQILLLVVASPTIVASTLTLEREQKTLDMLLATPLSIGQIARSKLMASLSIFFVLLLVSLPMISICFILGGVSPGEIGWAYFLTAEGILLAGAIGLCYSAYFKRTIAAVPMGSLTIIALLIATIVIDQALSEAVGLLNPLLAFSAMSSSWTTEFFALEIPFWVSNIILNILLFLAIFAYTIEILREEKRRASVGARVFLLLFYFCAFVFLLGSTIEMGPKFSNVSRGLSKFLYPIFFLLIGHAIITSGGAFTTWERAKLTRSWKQKYLRLRGWLGPGMLAGPRFSLLVSFSVIATLSLGVWQIPILPNKILFILQAGGILVVSTLFFAMLTRLLSLTPRVRGRVLPRILSSLVFLGLSFLPILMSYLQHKDKTEIPVTTWDMLLPFSPFFGLSSVLDPANTISSHPYLEQALGKIPVSFITVLIYICLLVIVGLLNALCERAMRKTIS